MFEETQERAKVKQLELEREIEEKSRNYEQTIQEIQEKSEEQLSQLKSLFEIEKDRLERRH